MHLDGKLADLLNRGPKFALTRTVTDNLIKEVEIRHRARCLCPTLEKSTSKAGVNSSSSNFQQQQRQQQGEREEQQRQQHQQREQQQQQPRPEVPPNQDQQPDQSQPDQNQPDQNQSTCAAQLRPCFPDGGCSQAPLGCTEMEGLLQQVKKKVTSAYKNYKKPL